MRITIAAGLLLSVGGFLSLSGQPAPAQPPDFDPAGFEVPDQFYTNGVQVDTWNRDDARQRIVTIWFGKNPKNSVFFRQLIAVRNDNDRDNIYYFDSVGRRYVGRYDMRREGYSLLQPEHRRERLQDIQEQWFPPPGDKPAIGDLFDPTIGLPNQDQLMMPPVTMEFPRLEQSTWEGFYTEIRSHQRKKMRLEFDGRQATYAQSDDGFRGRRDT